MKLSIKFIGGKAYLSWCKISDAHHYKIMGLSQTFAYSVIEITSKGECKLDNIISYIRLKIIAESVDNKILEESNEVDVQSCEIENFEITALNGFHGTTLVFRSKGIYDLYKIYSKAGLIAETEDSILELSRKITDKELGEIVVEGYIKTEDEYVLSGMSNGIVNIPERKKSDYKLSIVIPVYNAESFLPRTVDSILSSSMPDIEVILVDDGSKDSSLNICKWYAKHFSCVRVIQQKNQGVCAARNNGMNQSQGEYIGFVDNDDIVHPLMYEKLYNACKVEKTDIAISSVLIRKNFYEKELYLTMPRKKENVVIYSYEDVMNNIHSKDNMYFVAVRNKIFKKKYIKLVKFPTEYPNNIVLYEDSAYTPTLYSYINRFAFCKDAYYIWDKRKQNTVGTASTMHKKESNDNVWKAFIYAYSYPIYNRCEKCGELSDYTNFKRLIESYDKFKTPSALLDYWNEKLKELIVKQKLMNNKLIMQDDHLKDIIEKLS